MFTNGCFDILHPGHCDYLAKARSYGDALLVERVNCAILIAAGK